jgi:hypothetical protein
MPNRQFVATCWPLVDGDPTIPLAVKIEPFRQHDTDDAFGFLERIDEVVDTTQAEAADRMYADPGQEAIATLDVATLSGQTVYGA